MARDLGFSTNQVSITSVEAAQWEDSCLGVRPPGTICTPVIVSGFRVMLSAGNRQFEAHVNQDGSSVFKKGLWMRFSKP